MMRNLLLLFITLVTFGLNAQTVTLSDTSVVVQGEITDTDLHSYIMVKNDGSEEISLLWKRNIDNLPDGWISWICDANNCYVDFVSECPTNKPNVLGPGEEFELQIHANPKNTSGSVNINMQIFTVSNPETILNEVDIVFNAGTSTSTSNLSKDAIKVFPNPATNFFQINYPDVSQVTLFSIVGSQVAQFNAAPNRNYDVSGLKNGMYLVRMTDEQNKVIKTVRLSKR